MLLQCNFIFHFHKAKLCIHIFPLQFHAKECLFNTFSLETSAYKIVSDILAKEVPLQAKELKVRILMFSVWGTRLLTANAVVVTWQYITSKQNFM